MMEQLALTDYEEIRERLEHCIERLEKLPSEIEASVTQSSHLETKEKQFIEKLGDIEVSVGKYRQQKDRFCTAFEMEYQLGYVELSVCGKRRCGRTGGEDMQDVYGEIRK